MNPLKITASNYRTFERLDVDLPSGCVAIIGENGAGKSSILNLVDVALFAGRGELPPLLTTGEEELCLELEFEHAGELYRVRRQFSARGRGKTTCDFEKGWSSESTYGHGFNETTAHAGGWEPLTRETGEQTQKLIDDTLGLSRTTFRASTFLRQGDGAAFTEAQPRDRKAILAEILGLSIWERLQERARADLRRHEDDLVKAETLARMCEEAVSRNAILVEELQLQGSRLAVARTTLTAGEAELDKAQRDLAAASAIADRIRACEAELAAAAETHARASEDFSNATRAAHALADKQVELEELQADAEQIVPLEKRLDELRAALLRRHAATMERDGHLREADLRATDARTMAKQAETLRDEATNLRTKADQLEDLARLAHVSCDRCGQTLGAEAAARAADSYRADVIALAAKAQQIENDVRDANAEIRALRDRAAEITVPEAEDAAPTERILAVARRAAEQAATVTEQIRQLTEKASYREQLEQDLSVTAEHVTEKQTAVDAAKETVVDLTAVQARADRWKIAVQEARGLIENRQADVVRAETELARVADAEQQLAQLHSQIQKVNERVDVLKLAENAYGRDGIPALILESSAVPWIETEGNRILAELGTPYRVELRTQRALKGASDHLRETLDVIVNDGENVRPYETFSGGERTRINLALRLALAGLLAHRRGAESRVLCIDEPDGLDSAGMDRLAEVLRGLLGTFSRIVVVSHQPQLATAFDQVIAIEKVDGRSRIVGAREEVAA